MIEDRATGQELADKARRMFSLWMIRFGRRTRLVRAERERLAEIQLHNKYEFVGGPMDGKAIQVFSTHLSHYVGRGVYDLGADNRFHYTELAKSWFGE